MPTGFIYHPRFLDHDTGKTHPERPDRLRAIVERLQAVHLWQELTHLNFEPADRKWLESVHTPQYVQRVFDACKNGDGHIDAIDSAVCPASAEVAQLAVGGTLRAVDGVMRGELRNAFCAIRPPGHHAEPDKSMGFCLFNNVAIAAEYLIREHGLKRVAIIDFDVHHGNGTQKIFEHRSDVLFISVHEHPRFLYPGDTGYVHETGVGQGEGFNLNLPLDPRGGNDVYRHTMVFKVTPALERFEPDFLLLSSGFDACRDDPLAHMEVTPQGFRWITRHLKEEAERLCGGRLVSVLEGGYDLRCLAESVDLHIKALREQPGEDHLMAMKAGF